MGRRILIINDDRNVHHFQVLFSKLGCEAMAASSSEGLGHALATSQPDVVMVDVSLSDIIGDRGFEIVRTVKQAHSNTTVVLMTDHGNPVLVDRAYASGVDYYAEKPITAELALRYIG